VTYSIDFPGLKVLRDTYLAEFNSKILARKKFDNPKTLATLKRQGWPHDTCISIADTGNIASVEIAEHWAAALPGSLGAVGTAQGTGSSFETILRDFLNAGFELLAHAGVEAAKDIVAAKSGNVKNFDQYSHLAAVESALVDDPQLEVVFGRDYGIKPDIVVFRKRHDSSFFGARDPAERIAQYSPFFSDARLSTPATLILEAIVSCKLTIRSDRVQNIRPEAANAVRTRKGRMPRIVAVTAEPLCSGGRLEAIALGTGDVDCVYHSALPELEDAMVLAKRHDEAKKLKNLIDGRRLRDVSDLLFDLLI
jgi:hypothetical protein